MYQKSADISELSGEEWNDIRQDHADLRAAKDRGNLLVYCTACHRIGSQKVPLQAQLHVDFSSWPHKRQHVCDRGVHVEYLIE